MLAPGTPFGPYTVASLLGAGGMGEVYRAHDPRLGRDVAIKVLPEVFANDPERVARFTREAQTLAALSHANIATIFGVEPHGDTPGLVMELVEGPTLAEKLAAASGARTGSSTARAGLPVDEALEIAWQIAEGVAAAHERGIIHRDLKPANIKIAADGTVKILDFGLAKAMSPDAAALSGVNSPTISLMATGAGVLLGTAPYMSPVQARGGAVDKRTDVWAFGCVLFEMLGGRPVFTGDTVSDTLAAVLRADPDWGALPADTPRGVVRLLKRCLARDRKQRLADLHDAALDLAEARDWPQPEVAAAPTHSPPPRGVSLRVAGALAVVSLAAGALLAWALAAPMPVGAPVRFTITLPQDWQLPESAGSSAPPVFSADGRTVFAGAEDRSGEAGVLAVSLNDFGVREVADARGMVFPFVSPDGQWLAGSMQTRLFKAPIGGGTIVPIAGSRNGRAAWGRDGRVYGSTEVELWSIGQDGGTPTPLTAASGEPLLGVGPTPIGGGVVLFTSVDPQLVAHVAAYNLDTKQVTTLVEGRSGRVAPSGHLVFWRDAALWSVPFDLTPLQIRASPVMVVNDVSRSGSLVAGPGRFDLSPRGDLAFVPATGQSLRRHLRWVDRRGQATPASSETAAFEGPRISPDGKTVVVSDGGRLSLIDLQRGSRVLMSGPANNDRRPIWTADSKAVVFLRGGDVYRQSVDGVSSGTVLDASPGTQFTDAVSRDGTMVVFNEGSATRDLWLLRDGKRQPLLATPANERGAALSPEGAWIAYTSDASGRDEIYLDRFPAMGARVPVSTRGGRMPVWSRDGKELFYREGNQLMAVPVAPGAALGAPVALFDVARYTFDPNVANYDVAGDGRFLMVEEDSSPAPDEIRIILNFPEELRRKLPR